MIKISITLKSPKRLQIIVIMKMSSLRSRAKPGKSSSEAYYSSCQPASPISMFFIFSLYITSFASIDDMNP